MKKKICSLLPLFTLLHLAALLPYVSAQQDSIVIDFAKLDHTDLKIETTDFTIGTMVISGSRSEKDIADLPFTIYVISGEEIRQNGYLTLADVLKRLPGIRVSQPGSAEEGETFLMRGLKGNSYTKILINDVPIKPFVTNGMPIGAQLPIRDAERIEVIYGPAATLYGADASAGVVNIILKKTNRPVYVQAALGFGSDGHQNLDIMFNGKLGKGKRIVDFSVFGNYTSMEDRRTKYDVENLYRPSRYAELLDFEDFLILQNHPNAKGTLDSVILGELPHQSRALGIDVYYKRLHFFTHRFYRRDHSAVGLSPLAYIYDNPLNYFGENIHSGGLEYILNKKRFRFKGSFILLSYDTDPNSSYTYLYPFTNVFQHSIAEDLTDFEELKRDSLQQLINSTYYGPGSRYSNANSTEGNLQFLFGYTFNKSFEMAWGFNGQTGEGKPISHFLKTPFNGTADSPLPVASNSYIELNAFLENYINIGRWNGIVGAQLFTRSNDLSPENDFFFNPRIALQYRINRHLRLRSSTGTAFRYPSPYYAATSIQLSYEDIYIKPFPVTFNPEKTFSADLGLRWSTGDAKLFGDVSAYFTKTTDFIRYQLRFTPDEDDILLGYANDDGSEARIYGLQSTLQWVDIIPAAGLGIRFNFNYTVSRESARTYFFGEEDLEDLDLDRLRSQPKVISQLDISLKPTEKISFLFENTFLTKSLTQNSLLYQIPEFAEDIDLENPGYYTLDVVLNYRLNKNINAYVKVINFFNNKYAGLDATSDSNSLLYNPQSLRFTRVGVNYKID